MCYVHYDVTESLQLKITELLIIVLGINTKCSELSNQVKPFKFRFGEW